MTITITRIIVVKLTLALCVGFAGCATTGSEPAPASKPPSSLDGARPVTDFGASLRCMDNLLLDFGAGNITLSAEGLVDQSPKAQGRETLLAAISAMTPRSRAIRLMADSARREHGSDGTHYSLRGTLNAEGMQLGLLAARDNTIVPGVTARNSFTRVRHGSGSRTTTELHKLGQRFGLPAGADENRVLAELSAIELIGKLTKVPYWSCIGASDQNEAVSTEIQDWFDSMVERPVEIIGYFQRQMRLRGVYQGPLNGQATAEFKDAIARYREALGLAREAKFSLDFFQAYLSADHRAINDRLRAAAAPAQPPVDPAVTVGAVPPRTAVTATPLPSAPDHPAEALAIRVAATNAARRFARGEVIQFQIQPNRDAHVYCYLQDENRKILPVFPNRFQHDSRVEAVRGLQLPGAMRFEISMNKRGVPETVLCLAAPRDVLAALPTRVTGRDFEPLPAQSLDEVRNAFLVASAGQLAHAQFEMLPR